MTQSFDVVVAGLGAVGSATAAHLAGRGMRVLGLDRFHPPHTLGSSHGETRIIREAYFEDPRYVPLVQRAFELWDHLERATGRTLGRRTGGLMIGPPDGELVTGALRSARTHGLEHQVLDRAEAVRRVPPMDLAPGDVAVWEPRAGVLHPETCIVAHLEVATRHGAELRMEEPLLRWRQDGGHIVVDTASGSWHANALVLAAGAWNPKLLAEDDERGPVPLTVERQTLFWFRPKDPAPFAPDRFPIWIWEHSPGRFFYGFPAFERGVKVAIHREGEPTDPDLVRRDVAPEESRALQELLARKIPTLGGAPVESAVCMYTSTPDGHFVVDQHPRHESVWIASPCSGHGFKFASVLGEALAARIAGEAPGVDLSLFEVGRFTT